MMIEPGRTRLSNGHRHLLLNISNTIFCSVVSFWEIGLKVRKGKLDLGPAYNDLENRLGRARAVILPLAPSHALGDANLPAAVKDPFDRMIATIAEIEDLRLVTTDRALLDHPLAWRP